MNYKVKLLCATLSILIFVGCSKDKDIPTPFQEDELNVADEVFGLLVRGGSVIYGNAATIDSITPLNQKIYDVEEEVMIEAQAGGPSLDEATQSAVIEATKLDLGLGLKSPIASREGY